MEGCPESNDLLYLVLSTLLLVFSFVLIKLGVTLKWKLAKTEQSVYRSHTVKSTTVAELQPEILHEKASKNKEKGSGAKSLNLMHFDESCRTSPSDESTVDRLHGTV